MKCKVCKNKMKEKRGDVELWKNGKLVLVKGVDFFQCDNCGERVYSRETTSEILKRLQAKSSRKYMRVPVYT